MVSSNACSSFSSQKYPHQEQDGLIRRIRSLNTQRRGFSIPFQVPLNLKYAILNQSHFELPNKSHSQRSLASTSNLENIKKPLSNNRRLFRRCFPSALEHGNVAKIPSDHSTWIDFSKKLNAFYRFSRPHTVIGTVVGIISVSLLPVETMADLSPTFLVGLLKALIPSILMNIYVVGLNQLFDVEIDKVNKPDLPLASRDFSMRTGAAIVAICFFMSLAMGFMFQSPPLLCALLISFLLGSAYSINLPFLRWKKHALLAATTIISVRALVVQFAFFAHMQKYVLGKPIVFTKPMVFATAFMCFFSAVIALFKDIPDLDGDRDFGIQSFTVRLGPEKVFWLCIYMLLMAYGTAVMVGACSSYTFNKLVTVLGHCTLACILWLRARSIDLTNKASVTSFYMFIWKLFYVEYFLIPFVR